MFNEITGGGLPNKTLNIILAGTGVGKSLAMCHLAADGISQGKNVLYITMEMAEERIAERIDANLFDVRIDQLDSLSKENFNSKIKKVSDKVKGQLIIKEYPTAGAHVGHFRALLTELKMKKQFEPDVIFIDYLNICASSRIKGLSGGVNTYSLIKSIAEEVRGLAVEFNVPIWSATQVTRSGFNNSDVDLTDTSESFGLPATADLMIALISNEQLEGMNQIMVKQLKNRYNDPSNNKRFVIGVDKSKMRLYDVADPTQDIIDDSKISGTKIGNSDSMHNIGKNLDFSGFKV
jgi:replicative DNA helicase